LLLVSCRRAGGRRLAATLAVLLGALCTGCGDDDTGAAAAGRVGQAGSGGTLVWAIASAPRVVDPLQARSRAEQLVSRQIYEPLVEQLVGPFGDVRVQPGLAVPRATAGETVWRLELRPGVRFQDGRPFDAAAVLANARRWQSSAAGQALLPDLRAVDAPRPDMVRFLLDRPDSDFSADLSAPQLGIVSPRVLHGGGNLPFAARGGTGPYELREHSADHALVARNLEWWGTSEGLGPGLDQVEFRVGATPSLRLQMLRSGEAQVADELGPSQLRGLRSDPLLTYLRGPARTFLGLSRSVRGIASARTVPGLSGAWLTTIRGG
jgi:peptide/nickel transport system substrate-binding protein